MQDLSTQNVLTNEQADHLLLDSILGKGWNSRYENMAETQSSKKDRQPKQKPA